MSDAFSVKSLKLDNSAGEKIEYNYNTNPSTPSSIFSTGDDSETAKENDVASLVKQYKDVQDEQGFIGKAWNNFKKWSGLGHSSEDVQYDIARYEIGELSLEEAQDSISKYKSKQAAAANTVASVTTGLVVAGTTAATGGLSLAAIGAGAAVGAGTKASIKFADRATNNVENDAFNAKQITKDALSGAVDGIVTTATAGIGKGAVIEGQTVKQAFKSGVINGAKAGGVAGAASGAANYSLEAAFEDDVDFNVDNLIEATLSNAASGALVGGALGGLTSARAQSKLNKNGGETVNATGDGEQTRTTKQQTSTQSEEEFLAEQQAKAAEEVRQIQQEEMQADSWEQLAKEKQAPVDKEVLAKAKESSKNVNPYDEMQKAQFDELNTYNAYNKLKQNLSELDPATLQDYAGNPSFSEDVRKAAQELLDEGNFKILVSDDLNTASSVGTQRAKTANSTQTKTKSYEPDLNEEVLEQYYNPTDRDSVAEFAAAQDEIGQITPEPAKSSNSSTTKEIHPSQNLSQEEAINIIEDDYNNIFEQFDDDGLYGDDLFEEATVNANIVKTSIDPKTQSLIDDIKSKYCTNGRKWGRINTDIIKNTDKESLLRNMQNQKNIFARAAAAKKYVELYGNN